MLFEILIYSGHNLHHVELFIKLRNFASSSSTILTFLTIVLKI